MQWSLFLLILMGQGFFVMSQLYQYKFINETKKWKDAQSYCRSHYTDLATVFDVTDMKQLSGADAWIGLKREEAGHDWEWSDGSSSDFRLNTVDEGSDGNCVSTQSGRWSSAPCDVKKFFFCYEDKMILIKKEKTWEEALDYCREKHHDLVSITNQTQQTWVEEEVKKAGTDPTAEPRFIWLGLRYTCTLGIWFWVNGEVLNLDNFESTQSPDCNSAAAMKTSDYKWVKQGDDQKFNFICVKY